MKNLYKLAKFIFIRNKKGSKIQSKKQKLRKREKYFSRLNRGHSEWLFIHINKNGGRSIEHALQITKFHSTALEFKKEILPNVWDNMYKFSFVRNPWDRAVSLYKYRMLRGKIDQKTSFKQWAEEMFSDPSLISKRKRVNVPQTHWLVDEEGEIIVDFIGRFENFDADFNRLCKIINVKATLPHLNKTQHKHYSYYYDDKTRNIIENYFKEDIDTFNYKFEEKG